MDSVDDEEGTGARAVVESSREYDCEGLAWLAFGLVMLSEDGQIVEAKLSEG